jgi:hypothetical protein
VRAALAGVFDVAADDVSILNATRVAAGGRRLLQAAAAAWAVHFRARGARVGALCPAQCGQHCAVDACVANAGRAVDALSPRVLELYAASARPVAGHPPVWIYAVAGAASAAALAAVCAGRVRGRRRAARSRGAPTGLAALASG